MAVSVRPTIPIAEQIRSVKEAMSNREEEEAAFKELMKEKAEVVGAIFFSWQRVMEDINVTQKDAAKRLFNGAFVVNLGVPGKKNTSYTIIAREEYMAARSPLSDEAYEAFLPILSSRIELVVRQAILNWPVKKVKAFLDGIGAGGDIAFEVAALDMHEFGMKTFITIERLSKK